MELINKRKLNILIVISTIFPIAFFLFIIIKYNNDIICSDEFIFMIPRVQNLFEGNFSFYNDIWAHLNEHRSIFPIIIILFLARFADWNLAYELAIGIFFYIVLFLLIIYQFKKTRTTLGIDSTNWVVPISSLLIFSITQGMTFTMGLLTLQNSLLILSATAGIIIISQNKFSWYRFSAAVLSGTVSTFSFGAGLVYWPAGFFSLLCSSHDNISAKRLSIILWIAVSFAVIMLYSLGFSRDINIWPALYHPFEYMKFVLCYLGAPVCNFNLNGAAISGAIGILGSFCFAGILVKHKHVKFTVILPYISLSVFSILSAFLSGIGRSIIFPVEKVLMKEWKIIATPFWISFFVFLYLVIYFAFYENSIWFKRFKNFNAKKSILTFSTIVLISAILVSYSFSCSNSFIQLRNFYHKILAARAELLQSTDNGSLDASLIWPIIILITQEDIQKGISFLKKHKLSFFRDDGPYYYEKEKEIDDTIVQIRKAQDASTGSPILCFQLGRLYEQRGETEKAIVQYQKILSSDHNKISALNRLAEIYTNAEKYSTSISFYKKIYALVPSWEVCNNIGLSFVS